MTAHVTESTIVVGTPDQVWPLVTEGRHVRTWYAFGGAEIDARPGGAMTLRWNEHGAFAAVVETVRPPESFAFRWLPGRDPLVVISLRAEGDRSTRVEIVESGQLENPEQSALAWRNGLALLRQLAAERNALHWYARPVLFVSDVNTALRFYVDQLGFTRKWHVDGVCQVDRGGCEIILCQDPKRTDRSRLFVELTRDGIDELRREIAERSVPAEKMWWGYDSIRVVDPDGNELLFPLDETNDRERTPDSPMSER